MAHSPPPPPGRENHGGVNHVCHNCGWTFPNPHPSAKLRRAHKKVCGKVEGIQRKPSDSNDISGEREALLSPSSHDLSDGDQYSPVVDDSTRTFKLLQVERQASNRSEEEVFADAVAEFNETCSSPTVESVPIGRHEETAINLSSDHVLETPPASKSTSLHDATSDDQFWSPEDSSFSASVSPNSEIDGPKAISRSPVDILSEGSRLEIKNPSSDFIGSTSMEPVKTVEIVDNKKSGVCDSAHIPNVCLQDVIHNSSSNMVVLETEDDQTDSDIPQLQNNRNKPALSSHPGNIENELLLVPENCVQINSCEVVIVQEVHKEDGEEFHVEGEEVHMEDLSIDRSQMASTEPIHVSCDADQGQAVSPGQCSQLNDLTQTSSLNFNDGIGDLAIPLSSDQVLEGGLQVYCLPEALDGKVASDMRQEVIAEGLVGKASSNLNTVEAVDSVEVEASSSLNLEPVFEFQVDETLDRSFKKDSIDDECRGVNVEVNDPCAVINSTQSQERNLQVDSLAEVSAVGCSSERELGVVEGEQLVKAQLSEVFDGFEVGKLESEVLSSTLQVVNDAAEVNVMVYENVKVVPVQDQCSSDVCIRHEKTGANLNAIEGLNGDDKVNGDNEVSCSGRSIDSVQFEVGYEVVQIELTAPDLGNSPNEDKKGVALASFENRSESVSSVSETDTHFSQGHGINKVVENVVEPTDTILIADGADLRSQLEKIPQPNSDSYQESLHELDSCLIPPVKKTDAGIIQHMVVKGDMESCAHSSVTTEDYITEGLAKGNQISQEEIGDEIKTKETRTPLTDASVDSGSLNDSVEGCWGSVSDGGHQPLPSTNAEMTEEDPPSVYKKIGSMSEVAPLENITEALSFMTLVEPVHSENKEQPLLSAENQCMLKAQEPTSISSQAGWFPSVGNVPSDKEVRKNNEEIIEKVVNWSSGTSHMPLRSLLVEANLDKNHQGKLTVPSSLEHEMMPPQEDSDFFTKPSKEPKQDNFKGMIEKEWNSPARLSVNKGDRKKRGKSYWVPFLCCSSAS